MDKQYLIRRRQTWYVRVRVPPGLSHIVGKNEIVKTLQTRDLSEARHRRWKVVEQIKTFLSTLERKKPDTELDKLMLAARQIRDRLRLNLSPDPEAEQHGWDALIDQYISREYKGDSEAMPEEEAEIIRRGSEIVSRPDTYLLSEC